MKRKGSRVSLCGVPSEVRFGHLLHTAEKRCQLWQCRRSKPRYPEKRNLRECGLPFA
jgi:hypothetical protein